MKIHKIICLLGFILLTATLSAEDRPKVMLINSNASVERYKIAQEEFKKASEHPVLEVDLGSRKWKLADIEDLLYDEYPNLVYCIGSKAYLVANKFISERHIVFSSILNWQRLPVTQKTYGVSNELSSEMQIMLFRHFFPAVEKIGVLYSTRYNSQWFKKAQEEIKEMGVEVIGQVVSKGRHTVSALKELMPKIDALWLISDPVIMAEKKTLVEVFKASDDNKTPIFAYHEAFAGYGAVLIVSVDIPTIGRQAAGVAMEVLSGEKMEEKVQFPAGSYIIMNMKKVKQYSLRYNENALASVNRIIE
jgi:putative ABC transport system substrate-binding protein